MSSVAVLPGVPPIIEGGTTVRFTDSHSDYPASAWTCAFVLNNGIDAPLSIGGTASGNGFSFVITATQTAALTPGEFGWAEIFTAIAPTSEKAIGRTGALEVLPNIATQTTPTFAQAQVTLLEGALAAFSGNTFQSVSFNGQSFSRGDIGSIRSQLIYWKSRVIAERRHLASMRGTYAGGHIPVKFVPGLPEETCSL